MSTFFISDLHLDASRPKVTERFFRFLNEEARNADALYILGDFFEVWMGDDILSLHDKQVMEKLKIYAQKIPTYFMHGNRDFLINDNFLKQHHITLVKDPTLIELYGKRVLLMHGDSLCRNDVRHQRFRRFTRHPIVQGFYLKLPFFIRQKIAYSIRQKSMTLQAKDHSDHTLLDNPHLYEATADAIQEEMIKHNADILIHGHTHQPLIEEFLLEERRRCRIVLGDWGHKSTLLEYTSEQGPRLVEIHIKNQI